MVKWLQMTGLLAATFLLNIQACYLPSWERLGAEELHSVRGSGVCIKITDGAKNYCRVEDGSCAGCGCTSAFTYLINGQDKSTVIKCESSEVCTDAIPEAGVSCGGSG